MALNDVQSSATMRLCAEKRGESLKSNFKINLKDGLFAPSFPGFDGMARQAERRGPPLFALRIEVPNGEEGVKSEELEELHFSAGNPRIERITGVVRLFTQRLVREHSDRNLSNKQLDADHDVSETPNKGQSRPLNAHSSSNDAAPTTNVSPLPSGGSACTTLGKAAGAKEPGPRLPAARGCFLCVLSVPPRVSVSEFCAFVGASLSQVEELRFLRDERYSSTSHRSATDGTQEGETAPDDGSSALAETSAAALLKFTYQDAADAFYTFYNGKRFHSLQPEVCTVLFVSSISIESTAEADSVPDGVSGSLGNQLLDNCWEVPSCPVCLERLDEDTGGVVTTVCSHSFHSSCLAQWNDASCPVCRYCQSPPEPPMCAKCGSSEDVWICLICGAVGCGRYSYGHAKEHWLETSHCYSMELSTKRVWDYVGDTYVHRLLQSKAGQFVEVEPEGPSASMDHMPNVFGETSADISNANEWQQAVLNSKADAIAWEYNQLLTSQLESQRQYFEQLLYEAQQTASTSSTSTYHHNGKKKHSSKQQTSSCASASQGNSQKVIELQQRLKEAEEERDAAKTMNDSLMSNQYEYQKRVANLEKQLKDVSEEKEARIKDLEEQVRDLMMYIEAGKAVTRANAADAREGTAFADIESANADSNEGVGENIEYHGEPASATPSSSKQKSRGRARKGNR